MKHKLLTLLLAIMASLGSLFAESGTCGDNLTWDLTDGVLTISGTGEMTDFSYPNEIPWYSQNSSITSVIINYGVTSIGKYAFYGYSNLSSATIPNSVKNIGERGFFKCTGLTSITIPNSIDSIGYQAFYQCTGLTSVHIDDLSAWCKIKFNNFRSNPTNYAHKIYLNGELIRDLVIPADIEKIQENAFYGCDSLTSVTIPANITSIGDYAFYECSNIMNITNHAVTPQTIKSNVWGGVNGVDKSLCTLHIPAQSVGLYNAATGWREFSKIAFLPCDDVVASGNCGNSNNVTWELFCDGVLTISGTGAMTNYYFDPAPWSSYSATITSVIISDGVTSIGRYAFRNCSNMTSVTIPNSVTTIGSSAFSGCSSLTSVTIPNSVTSIGGSAFEDCSSLTNITIPNAITWISESCFRNCTSLTSVYIPDNVTGIEVFAFKNCSSLASVHIGSNVNTLGYDVFNGTALYSRSLNSFNTHDMEHWLL